MKDSDYGFIVRRQISKSHIVPAVNAEEARYKLENSIYYDDPLDDYDIEHTTIIYTGKVKPAHTISFDGDRTLTVTTGRGTASMDLVNIIDELCEKANKQGR